MAKRTNDEITIVIPGLTRGEAIRAKHELIEMKMRIAPKADAGIVVGKKERFERIMEKCRKEIGG